MSPSQKAGKQIPCGGSLLHCPLFCAGRLWIGKHLPQQDVDYDYDGNENNDDDDENDDVGTLRSPRVEQNVH